MRTWDFFYPDVLPDVLGCPEPTVDRHLLRAARHFCEKTRAWRVDLEPIVTQASLAEYDLLPPDSTSEVFRVHGAALDGTDIGVDTADSTTTGERVRGNVGPDRILTLDLVTLTIMPMPAAGRSLVLTVNLQPSERATGIPDDLADRYRTAISDGALSTLLMMNKQPWANPMLAAAKAGMFQSAIASAQSKAWRANGPTRQRTRAQYF